MAETKKKESGDLEGKVKDESEGLSMKIPIQEIEKLFSPLTYQNLEKGIGNLLSRVRKDHANDIGEDGRFKNPEQVAKEITQGIANEILPNLDFNDATNRKYVRELLRGRGVIYDQIKKTLNKVNVTDEVDFASKLKGQFANTIKDSYQKEAHEYIATYMSEEEGRNQMMERVREKAGIKWRKGAYIDAGDIITIMSAYMAQPGIFDEKGKVKSEKTKLPDEVVVDVGKGLIEDYDTVYKRHQQRLLELHPGVKKKKDTGLYQNAA